MDAPQITTLGDEGSPTTGTPKRIPTIKYRIGRPEPSTASAVSSMTVLPAVPRPREFDNEEEEEDQLLDDDEDGNGNGNDASTMTGMDASPKRKAAKAGAPRGRKRKADTVDPPLMGSSQSAPMITTFDITSPETHVNSQIPQTGDSWEQSLSGVGQINVGEIQSTGTGKDKAKKRATRKDKGIPRKKNLQKVAVLATPPPPPPPVILPPPEEEDVDDASEIYSNTPGSSPTLNAAYGDMDPDPLSLAGGNTPSLEEVQATLHSQPIPAYPAPSKAFSVLPPPKMGSGFAPNIPLDRTRAQVRRWRPLLREVRGIAGGRWFTKSWVGDKESAYASIATPNPYLSASVSAPTIMAGPGVPGDVPPVYAPPVPARRGRGRGRGGAFASSANSRSGSAGPDAFASAVRAPTKMRTVIAPDVDVVSVA